MKAIYLLNITEIFHISRSNNTVDAESDCRVRSGNQRLYIMPDNGIIAHTKEKFFIEIMQTLLHDLL
jgi:hypothetical protein